MMSMTEVESWDVVSKKVYWDRDVPLEKWQEGIFLGHRSYLPDAVLGMALAEFVRFYGARRFIQDWPALRTHLPDQVVAKAGTYDLAWSRLVGGGWNLKPFPEFNTMPERRRQFLLAASKTPGQSIYELAKNLNMQYRRAHEHAVKLIGEQKLRRVDIVEGGRRKTRLYPSYKNSPDASA